MSRIDYDEAFVSASRARASARDCSTPGSASILFDATRGDGKSLKAWCARNDDKCAVTKPRFKGSSTGIIELAFPGAGKGGECIFKADAAHEAFGKSLKRQGFDGNISYSSVI
jgi:hypothetical protein